MHEVKELEIKIQCERHGRLLLADMHEIATSSAIFRIGRWNIEHRQEESAATIENIAVQQLLETR
jgi:hypothetical protein